MFADGNSLLKLDETSLLNLKEGDENHEMLTDLETRLFFSSLRSLELTLGADPQTLWEFRVSCDRIFLIDRS